jgi:hypothetical protein
VSSGKGSPVDVSTAKGSPGKGSPGKHTRSQKEKGDSSEDEASLQLNKSGDDNDEAAEHEDDDDDDESASGIEHEDGADESASEEKSPKLKGNPSMRARVRIRKNGEDKYWMKNTRQRVSHCRPEEGRAFMLYLPRTPENTGARMLIEE